MTANIIDMEEARGKEAPTNAEMLGELRAMATKTAEEKEARIEANRKYVDARIKAMSEAYLTINGFRQAKDAASALDVKLSVDTLLTLACDMSEKYEAVRNRIADTELDGLYDVLDEYVDGEFCRKGWADLVAVEELLTMEMCGNVHKLLSDVVESAEQSDYELRKIEEKIAALEAEEEE